MSAATSHALYVAYTPAGGPHGDVEAYLRLIEEHARFAVMEALEILRA